MAVTQKRTRQQIRQSVGAAVGALNMDAGGFTHTTSSGGSSFVISSVLTLGAANEHRGKWIAIASDANSSNTDAVRRVSASETSSGRLTLISSLPAATTTATTFELWAEDVSPYMVNDFINQSIAEVTRKGAVSVTSDSLHTGGGIRSFGLSSEVVGVQELEFRGTWTGTQLTTLDDVMSSGNEVSVATDSEDLREGSAAAKITVSDSASSNAVLATSSFTATDISGYTHLEFWAKTNVTTTASGLQVRLGEGSTARETIALPALNADSWTWVSVALANPELDNTITRFIPMSGASDGGSMTLWFDDVTVVRDDAENYIKVPRKFWSVDKENRQIRILDDAQVSYAKLRFNGVRSPNLLTTDSAVCEIDSNYVINSVVAKVLRARSDRRGSNRDAAYVQADRYEALAQTQRQRMNSPSNIRWVDD